MTCSDAAHQNIASLLQIQAPLQPDAIAILDSRHPPLTFAALEQAVDQTVALLQQVGLRSGNTDSGICKLIKYPF